MLPPLHLSTRLGGWRSLKMVEAYTHPTQARLDQAIDRLPVIEVAQGLEVPRWRKVRHGTKVVDIRGRSRRR